METKWNARNFAAAASAAFQLFDSSSSSSKNHSNNTNNEARPENNGSCACNARRECQPRQVVYLGYLRRTNWVSSVRQSCPQFCLSSSLPSPLSTPLAYALALKWPWKVGQTRKTAALAAYAAYLPLPLPLSPPLLPSSSALFNVFLSLVYLFDDNFQSEQVEVQKDSETEGRADGHGKQKTTRRQLPDIIFCSGSSAWNEEVNKELSVCRVRFPYALLFS